MIAVVLVLASCRDADRPSCQARATAEQSEMQAYFDARAPMLPGETSTRPALLTSDRPITTELSGTYIALEPGAVRIGLAKDPTPVPDHVDEPGLGVTLALPPADVEPVLAIDEHTPWWTVRGLVHDLAAAGHREVQLLFVHPDARFAGAIEKYGKLSIDELLPRLQAALRKCPAMLPPLARYEGARSLEMDEPRRLADQVIAAVPTCACDGDFEAFETIVRMVSWRTQPVSAVTIAIAPAGTPTLPIPDDRPWSEASVKVLAANGPVSFEPPSPPPRGTR